MTTDPSPAEGEGASELDTFAGRLEAAFRDMHPASRGPWEVAEVAAGIAAQDGDVKCSASYLWQLRRGAKNNPTIRQVQAIAKFFHVPVIFFVGTRQEAEGIYDEMELVLALRENPELEELVVSLGRINPAGLKAVLALVKDLASIPEMDRAAPKGTRGGTRATKSPEEA